LAYTKGDVQVITEESVRSENDLDSDESPLDYAPADARGDYEERLPVIVLPHSCDRWIIGGADEARQMIQDLTEAIKKFEAEVSARVG